MRLSSATLSPLAKRCSRTVIGGSSGMLTEQLYTTDAALQDLACRSHPRMRFIESRFQRFQRVRREFPGFVTDAHIEQQRCVVAFRQRRIRMRRAQQFPLDVERALVHAR